MHSRPAPRLGTSFAEIGFGAWAIGDEWGEVSETDAVAAVNASLDTGVTFIDTADVYGDGRSERIIAKALGARSGTRPFVATKAGRRLRPHVADGYSATNLRAFVERSRENLGMEQLDLVQLHCPPTEVYYRPEVFEALEAMKADGLVAAYGVSVEKVEEGLKAIEYPGVASVQIIYNMLRQRPAERFFAEAKARGVATIARVPLASGLLTGKLSPSSAFAARDHRNFNRHGEAFDVGETFSGVPYEIGLAAVGELRALVPKDTSMAAWALRWVLMNDAVTVVIPGAKNADQARANAAGATLPALPPATMEAIADLYRRRIAPHVHQRW